MDVAAAEQRQKAVDQQKRELVLYFGAVPLALSLLIGFPVLPSAFWQLALYCLAGGELFVPWNTLKCGVTGPFGVSSQIMQTRAPHGGQGKLASLGLLFCFMMCTLTAELVLEGLGWRSRYQRKDMQRRRREDRFKSRML